MRVPLRGLGALDVICAVGTALSTSSHPQSMPVMSRCPFNTAWDRGQPQELCHPRALHHRNLRFPPGHVPAGTEGEPGKRHPILVAIREETQLSAPFQLSSQQLDTAETAADGACCHPVPWLSPAPPAAFTRCQRNQLRAKPNTLISFTKPLEPTAPKPAPRRSPHALRTPPAAKAPPGLPRRLRVLHHL